MEKEFYLAKLAEISHIMKLVGEHITAEEAIKMIELTVLNASECVTSPSVVAFFSTHQQAKTFFNLLYYGDTLQEYLRRADYAKENPTDEDFVSRFDFQPRSLSIIGELQVNIETPFLLNEGETAEIKITKVPFKIT